MAPWNPTGWALLVMLSGSTPSQRTCEGIKRVPEGVIRGGCNAERNAECLGKTVPAFEISCGMVLRKSYQECVAKGACKAVRGVAETPLLVGATYAQAQRYCQWRKMRLPTEAEWERAREMEVLFDLNDSASEWLDGWYTWVPEITEEMREEGYMNSRLLMTMQKGHSFRYGGDPQRGFPFVGFRCARGGSSQ